MYIRQWSWIICTIDIKITLAELLREIKIYQIIIRHDETFHVLCNLCCALLQVKLGNIQPPEMLLRIYSLCILGLDLMTLIIGVCYTILIAVYRMFRPPPLKNINYEVAMVILLQSTSCQCKSFHVTKECHNLGRRCRTWNRQRTCSTAVSIWCRGCLCRH